MSQLTQSPFLQALGYTIINSLWQFALLWLIYVSIHTFLKLSSHQKYTAGLLIQAAGFMWFTATFAFYLQRFLQLEELYFLQQKKFYFALAGSNTSTVSERIFAGVMQAESLLPYLSVAYLLILLFLCIKWIRAYNLTKSIKTRGLHKIEVNWRLFVKQLSGQLGIKREVKIYLSEMVKAPLTIGFLKPFILIPLASLNHLTTEQMEAVILHELAHIKRFDYFFNLFLALIEITLFFNPFMHLISRHIKRERENCCDDWVLQYEYNAASYANALLQIATCQSSSLFALQAADNKKVLLNRIIRMIEKKEKTFFNYRYQLIALLVMLTVLSSLAVLSSRHRVKDAAISPSPGHVIAKPIYETVNSPLYNPDFFIVPIPEKANLIKKQSNEKTLKKPFSFNSWPAGITLNDTINDIIKKQIEQRIPIEANQVLFADQDESSAEDAEKNLETANAALAEARFPAAAAKEQEIALAEGQLKELAKNLFEENKTLINQKEVLAQIKAAFDQLKTIKIQLNGSKQKTSVGAVKRNAADENPFRTMTEPFSCDIDKLQFITKELQLQTEKAERQRTRVLESYRRYYNNNNFKIPQVIYHLPFAEKAHSFSFEFSTEPKVKVAEPNSFYNQRREKKVTKKCIEGNEGDFEPENLSPVIPIKPAQKDVREKGRLAIIRI